MYWEKQKFELPKLPPEYEWRCFADTALDGSGEENSAQPSPSIGFIPDLQLYLLELSAAVYN